MSQPGEPAACAVISEFGMPHRTDAFLTLAQQEASQSLTHKAGRQKFYIVEIEGVPHRVLFPEVYSSWAAFQYQPRSPHLARFQERALAL